MAIFLFSSVPIAISIGLAVIAGLLYQGLPLIMAAQNCFTAVDSFALMGLPFYMLCGTLMVNGGTAHKLVEFAKSLVGWITGGLGFITTLSCMFFGAISGSAPGTTAAIGSLMVPAMKKGGYKSELAAAITSCAGTIGIIIPPSIPFVIYGVASGVSVADMFIAGIVPGVLIGVGLMIMCYIMAKRMHIPRDENKFSFKRVLISLWDAKWAILVPVIILGGIYSGVFTPTESAVIACVYALIIGIVVYRQINFRTLMDSLIDACLMTGTTLIINGISSAFGQLLTIQKIPTTIANAMLSLSNDPTVILLLIIAVLLIVGCFFETLSAIIILTPIFLPVVKMFGMDPVHFGLVLVCGLAIGFVTPPLGTTLFIGAQLAETSLEKVLKYLWPFLLMMIFTLLIITFVPDVSLFMIRLLSK
ncbi:MAG: TRAP transporter large permease [Candidatus Heteroscillospira sp.]